MNVINTKDIENQLGEPKQSIVTPPHTGSEMFTIQCLRCNKNILIEMELQGAITNIIQQCDCGISKNHNSTVLRYFRRKVLSQE